MVFLKKVGLSIIFGILSTSFINAQEKEDLVEIKSANELVQFEGRDILAGYFPLHSSSSNEHQNGLEEIEISRTTSNFDADFFRKKRIKIKLESPLTMDFILWGNKITPSKLFFEKVGSNEYRIIGYSEQAISFLPTETLFPEFKDVDLINFDLEENAKVLEERQLVAGGGKITARHILAGKEKMTPYRLSYPTCNFDYKLDGAYMTMVNLSEDIDRTTLEWIALFEPRNLVFEKDKNKNSFRLIGYSSTSFF